MKYTNREQGKYLLGLGFGLAIGSGFKMWGVVVGIAFMAVGAWLQGQK